MRTNKATRLQENTVRGLIRDIAEINEIDFESCYEDLIFSLAGFKAKINGNWIIYKRDENDNWTNNLEEVGENEVKRLSLSHEISYDYCKSIIKRLEVLKNEIRLKI